MMYKATTQPVGADSSVDSSAIVLESIERVIERVEAQLRRRRDNGRTRRPSPRSRVNKPTASRREKIDLILYTSPGSEKCRQALRTIRAVLAGYDPAEFRFRVLDVAADEAAADQDSVIFTPTLVKRSPGPRTWIVGDLAHPELLVDLLELNGVSRLKP